MDYGKFSGELIIMVKEIVFMSRSFYPETGGIAEFGNILTTGLAKRGYKISVITNSSLMLGGSNIESHDFRILRKAKVSEIARTIRQAEVVILSHFSIKYYVYPFFLRKKKFVISHNAIQCDGKEINLKERVKNLIIARSTNVCVSKTLARYYPTGSIVIRNGVNLPKNSPQERNLSARDVIFVGRATPNKGLYTFLKSIKAYEQIFKEILEVTIVCNFNEMPHAGQLLKALELKSNFKLFSKLENSLVKELMTDHRFIVVPTLTEEPFGLVAIEGLLSGCIPIVSKFGGLSEATSGRCITFQNGDFLALARAMRECKQDYKNIWNRVFDQFAVDSYSSESMIDQYERLIRIIGHQVSNNSLLD